MSNSWAAFSLVGIHKIMFGRASARTKRWRNSIRMRTSVVQSDRDSRQSHRYPQAILGTQFLPKS